MRTRALVPAVLLALACSLEPIDLASKMCPCAQGWICEAGVCVPSGEPACDAAVTVTDFRASWATANAIRWEWVPLGDRTRFLRYEVHVAERPEDLGTSSEVVFGPSESPELGGYVLQRTGGADDIVNHTITDGHLARAAYVARLVAVDTSLCEHRSEIAAVVTTLDPPEEIVLFRDATSPGRPFPGTIRVVDEGGDAFLEHDPSSDVECIDSGKGVCSQNLRWSGIGVSAATISSGELANTAMLEILVANDTDTPSFFSRVWILLANGMAFRLEPFTIGNRDTYRTIQVPLARLVDDAMAPLDHADIVASPVAEVNVGGQWSRCAPGEPAPCTAARVRVDEARIRY